MNPQAAKTYLDSFKNYEIIERKSAGKFFRLGRVRRLLSLLRNPQQKLKFIHVAGSKGKGSTCAFVAYILQASGYRVGLYTSPHLYNEKERIRILEPAVQSDNPFCGKISDKQFCRLLSTVKRILESHRTTKELKGLTYFEILTVVAVLYFQKKKVDFAVLETGLGGRLDATNVFDSLVAAITPIGLEHTKELGPTLAQIAFEKAAIIKNKKQRVVVAPQKNEAGRVIQAHLKKFNNKNFVVGRDFKIQSVGQNKGFQVFHAEGRKHAYRNLHSRLLGQFQAVNAGVALGIIESLRDLGYNISRQAIYRGIRNARWPGRFEIVRKNPCVVLDGAHTLEAAQSLTRSVKEIFPGRKTILVLGISSDKNIRSICRELKTTTKSVILTKSDHPRAYDFRQGDVAKLFSGKRTMLTDNAKDAMKRALEQASKKDIILVAGSLFLVAEVRKICKK